MEVLYGMIRFTIHEYPARGHAMGHGGSVDCSEHGARVRVLGRTEAEKDEISSERSRFIDSLLAKYLNQKAGDRIDDRNVREIPAPANRQERAA
jgi:hypothetical protein